MSDTIYINKYSTLNIEDGFKWKDISQRPNERFGRYDPLTKAALAAVEQLELPLDQEKDASTALLLCTAHGCTAVDYHYLCDKLQNPPSPTLFTYTLPSVALGEIAIRYRLTGANLTLLDNDPYCFHALLESARQLLRGETEKLIMIIADGISPQLAEVQHLTAGARAAALLCSAQSSPDDILQLSLEKNCKNALGVLPNMGLLDYLINAPRCPWEFNGNFGKNNYRLTINFLDK